MTHPRSNAMPIAPISYEKILQNVESSLEDPGEKLTEQTKAVVAELCDAFNQKLVALEHKIVRRG
jgi:hypothetical protein